MRTTAPGGRHRETVPLIAATALIVGAALAACSGTSSPTPAPTTPTPAATSPAAPAPAGVPAPPAGATQLTARPGKSGGTFARYQTGQAASAVVSYYESALKSAGFSITSSGGGGGGWGQYGGSGAGVEANNSATFVAVEAGGSSQGPTYFEVCTGASAAQVSDCQNGDSGN